MEWPIQIIGMVGTALVILSFQFRGQKLFVLQMIAAVIFTVHFGLLGAYAGMTQNFLGVVRNALLSFDSKKWARSPIWFWLLNISYIVCGLITWQNWFSALPIIAMIVSTVAMWNKNGRHIRLAQLFVVSPCWITYNVSVFSISGIATESFNMISVLVSIARFGWIGLNASPSDETRKNTSMGKVG